MKAIMLFIKGAVIGTAAIIPGVSGSAFAVIVGVYDEIITFASSLAKDFRRSAVFLLPLVLGIGAGVLLSANPVLEICQRYPLYSYCFFIGVMLASIMPSVKKLGSSGRPKLAEICIMLICFAFITALRLIARKTGAGEFVSIPYLSGISDFVAMFFAGFLSVGMMTLPGVSGSVILLVLGQYGTVYKAAGSPARLIRAIFEKDAESAAAALGSSALLIPFFLGATVGAGISVKLIARLVKTRQRGVGWATVGFMTASVVTLVFDCLLPTVREHEGNAFLTYFLIFGFLLSGALLTLCFTGDKTAKTG